MNKSTETVLLILGFALIIAGVVYGNASRNYDNGWVTLSPIVSYGFYALALIGLMIVIFVVFKNSKKPSPNSGRSR